MGQFSEWLTEGVTFGNLAALLLVPWVFRDRMFGRVDLRQLDGEFRAAERDNKKAHKDLNSKIEAVRADTQYMRGVLDTLIKRVEDLGSSRRHDRRSRIAT